MTIAVVVVCSSDVRDSAVEWGGAGLVADSYWVSSVDAGLMDPDHPNMLEAHRIRPGAPGSSASLLASLANLGPLDEVRVAWIRRSEERLSDSLKSLESLLRQVLPPDQTTWMDVVVPTRRTDDTVVPLPGQWTQLRVVAEDRSAPDVTDAGWDLNLDVSLHATLAALGILGGTVGDLQWGGQSAADHYEMRAFSRVVLGALNTDAEVRRFIGRVIPEASAGTFFGHTYLECEPEQSVALVNDAVEHVLGLNSAALSYRDPTSSALATPPRLTVSEHIRLIVRFLGYCLPLLVGFRPRSKVVLSRFNFKDLGHQVGDVKFTGPKGLKPADFDALDAHAATEAHVEIEKFTKELSRKPPSSSARAWRTLYQLSTAINDGGQAPDGWDPPKQHDRWPVVTGRWVRPDALSSVTSTVAELAGARSPVVASAAVNDARRPRNPSLSAPTDHTGSVATAKVLVDEGNARDLGRLGQQLDGLDVSPGREPTNLLDRLAGRVHGGGLRARLDGERWTEFATEPSPPDPLDWNVAERTFRRRILTGVGASIAMAAGWGAAAYFLRSSLPAWLTMPIGFIVIGVIGGLFVLGILYAFFRIYSAFMERGRRRLELRAIWLARALHAMEEAARLAPARRILGRWLDILAAIYPFDGQAGELPERVMPSKAPKGMTVGLPVYTDREMTKWLSEEGAEVGWRLRALEDMAANAFEEPAADALSRLVADNGLQGGPLYEMWERRHSLWNDYATMLRQTSTADVAARMVDSDERSIAVVSPASGSPPRSVMPLKIFRSEPWPAIEDDDAAMWDGSRDFRVQASRHVSEHGVQHNPDTCLLAVRLQLRRCEVAEPPNEHEPKRTNRGSW